VRLLARSLAETHAVAAVLAGLARPGDVIVLAGEMGAGKTAFAQGFGRALGVTEPITSPTFTLVHSYPCGDVTLHHADLYRLDRTDEVADLALVELAEFDGIVLVEWGDVASASFGDHLEVRIETTDEFGDLDDLDDLDDPDEPRSAAGAGADVADEEDGHDDGRRWFEVTPVGSTWATRWDRLTRELEPFRC
jgi:tRNA threonylcarbamoyladenosine biosynthesis protein TsaE